MAPECQIGLGMRGNWSIPGEHPMRYTVVLEQEEDGGYVASVPALPGCVSQGDDRSEALKNIREAIELYVEDCREAGDPVPTEAGKEFVEIEAA
jgi:predicted RNase H-like HicB family nuclease